MAILVTGGLGYIGSHVVRMLEERGERPVVVDRQAAAREPRGRSVTFRLDLTSPESVVELRRIFDEQDVTSVIHLAALKQVAESVAAPAMYYSENIGGLANVLTAVEGTAVDKFVFSSSAAVYGNPVRSPVRESDAVSPINPYGETKLAGEWLVRDAARAGDFRFLNLRYFNVAGAGWHDLGDPQRLNLLTIAMDAVEHRITLEIFGDDYPTPDGTAIRDYIHVLDLAGAHIAGLDYLRLDAPATDTLNVGTGHGASVRQMVEELARVSGSNLIPRLAARRSGDPAAIVANVDLATAELGWVAKRGTAEIVESAWEAHLWQMRQGGSRVVGFDTAAPPAGMVGGPTSSRPTQPSVVPAATPPVE